MKIEVEREEDGRWIAEVVDLAGVMAYGRTRGEAIAKAQSLALRVIADRMAFHEGASRS
ncbi:MAG: type II toxin-antitoxin system HicB family antitoxin [Candidatus Aminicenantes bacterium]|nr:type II toxin-antitoxin system HicB family antitoxin [Candidatus Aminicenantes bacterium]